MIAQRLPKGVRLSHKQRFLCFEAWARNPNLTVDELAERFNATISAVSKWQSYGIKNGWFKLVRK